MKQILISIAEQRLQLIDHESVLMDVLVSTAGNGAGELNGSEKTPRGWHQVRAKIGADQPMNAVFVGRRPTGEIYQPQMKTLFPDRDWILTRILWLSGLEPGFNRLREVDTMRRYIYIHGCPDEDVMGQPGSHGCIKMRNPDLVDLFEQITTGTRVYISEQPLCH